MARSRHDREKSAKDIGQAGFLIETMSRFRAIGLADAWIEAWQRGQKWREALARGRALLPPDQNRLLEETVTGAAEAFGVKPRDVGMEG